MLTLVGCLHTAIDQHRHQFQTRDRARDLLGKSPIWKQEWNPECCCLDLSSNKLSKCEMCGIRWVHCRVQDIHWDVIRVSEMCPGVCVGASDGVEAESVYDNHCQVMTYTTSRRTAGVWLAFGWQSHYTFRICCFLLRIFSFSVLNLIQDFQFQKSNVKEKKASLLYSSMQKGGNMDNLQSAILSR